MQSAPAKPQQPAQKAFAEAKAPAPAPQKHPVIRGVAWFRTSAGWQVVDIETTDPSVIIGKKTEPNVKSIAIAYMKAAVAKLWESP